MLKLKLDTDLKAAMLAGDKTRVEVLKMLKSSILYKEVELGARDSGLNDEQIIDVLSKESKKRAEAAEMYEKAGRTEQANAEKFEQTVILEYLPKQASDTEIEQVVDKVIAGVNGASMQQMGQIIGACKAKLGNTADGSRVASIVKEKLS